MTQSETTNGIFPHNRLVWFEEFGYARPQCPVPNCLFIAQREGGAFECWKHGRFVVRSWPRDDADETTEQATLTT